MQSDFLLRLGPLGLTARIKRLSDSLSTGIRALYRAEGLDLEPSWHLVFLLLRDRVPSTVTEIATSTRLSQPAVTTMVQRMTKRGYLEVVTDPEDGRRRLVRLSTRAESLLPAFDRVWMAGHAAVVELLESTGGLLEGIDQLEHELGRRSFEQRALDRLHPAPVEGGSL